MTETDLELLKRYARDHAEDAFAGNRPPPPRPRPFRALRQVRSPQLAEESPNPLSPTSPATRTASRPTPSSPRGFIKSPAARQLMLSGAKPAASCGEQIATEMNTMNATTADWTHIEPLLDDAMAALDETDRAAVLLRYFENKSLREVGATLGTSDAAAQKRVSRAVERLREFFAKRGVTVGASGLVVVISANAVQAAPVGLAVTISTAAALAGTVVQTSTAMAATKTIAMTTMQKLSLEQRLPSLSAQESSRAARLRLCEPGSNLRRQQSPLANQIQQLQSERDEGGRQLAALRDENKRLNRDAGELLRLRGEVTRLRKDAQELAQSKTSDGNAANNPTQIELKSC